MISFDKKQNTFPHKITWVIRFSSKCSTRQSVNGVNRDSVILK
jgi:hypothetical protein